MFIESNNEMAKIAINKSLLKEYKTNTDPRVVYMNNGDEFQIQLFNPEQETIGAEVSINGKVIPGILVIRPGERIWLERYLTEQSKFKFTTYEVDDPDEDSSVARAIANNGTIEIKFYREKPKRNYWNDNITWTTRSSDVITKLTDYSWDVENKITSKGLTGDNVLLNAQITASGAAESNANYLSLDTKCCDSVANLSFADEVTTNCATTSSALRSTPIKKLSSKKLDLENAFKSATPISNKIETGRIDKGSYSNQKLEHVDIEFEIWHFKREVIKILPTSRKPYTSSDIQKIYCTNCGRKLNTKYKFCPYCGAKCIQL